MKIVPPRILLSTSASPWSTVVFSVLFPFSDNHILCQQLCFFNLIYCSFYFKCSTVFYNHNRASKLFNACNHFFLITDGYVDHMSKQSDLLNMSCIPIFYLFSVFHTKSYNSIKSYRTILLSGYKQYDLYIHTNIINGIYFKF